MAAEWDPTWQVCREDGALVLVEVEVEVELVNVE